MPNRKGVFVCPSCHKDFICSRTRVRNRIGCAECTNEAKLKVAVGDTYGRLMVLRILKEKDADHRRLCLVQCSCDNHTILKVPTKRLISGTTKSCGCLQREWAITKNKQGIIDLTGQKFGRLTALCRVEDTSPAKWKCLCDCGNITYVPLGELRRGLYKNKDRHGTLSCGCLSKSVGENAIKNILDDLNICYKREYTFHDCKNPETNCRLRFDFYLFDYDCCIEYDGDIHYKTNGGWNTKENLQGVKYRDNIKNEYCKKNNIHLIRIPYYDFKILDKQYILERLPYVKKV